MSNKDEATDNKWLKSFEICPVGTGEKMVITPDNINKMINAKATLAECYIYLNMCKSYGANPFLKDLHLVKYSENDPAAFVAGIGFFEKKAQLNPKFKGYKPTRWMNDKGDYLECFIPNKIGFGIYPLACIVSCYVEGYEEVQIQPVTWDECYGRKKDGKINSTWKKQPSTMLEKVAKVRLLRKLFSAELGGLYSEDEINAPGAQHATQVDDHPRLSVGEPVSEEEPEKAVDVEAEEIVEEVSAEDQDDGPGNFEKFKKESVKK